MNALKKILPISIAFAITIFFIGSSFAANDKPKSGKVYISCPAGACAVVVKFKNTIDGTWYSVGAGGKSYLTVKPGDTIMMTGAGLRMFDPKKDHGYKFFNVQPSTFKENPVWIGNTIVVTGDLYNEKYQVTGQIAEEGYPAKQ